MRTPKTTWERILRLDHPGEEHQGGKGKSNKGAEARKTHLETKADTIIMECSHGRKNLSKKSAKNFSMGNGISFSTITADTSGGATSSS
ncbi:hypothetical protein Tco_1265368 [Tanacetum coccineum]